MRVRICGTGTRPFSNAYLTRSVSALNLRLSPPMLLSPLVYATYDLMWNQECHT